jgi:two-component system, chemotaxis family, protein-glutamate methylesterase/glutaminase
MPYVGPVGSSRADRPLHAATRNPRRYVSYPTQTAILAPMLATRRNGVTTFGRVVLVASLGGVDAFSTVLAGLPATFPVPIAIAQHRKPSTNGDDALTQILARHTSLPVRTARHGASAHESGATIVSAGVSAAIDANGSWALTSATDATAVGDPLLLSSAEEVPTIAVILTGRLADGANGCRAVKRNGGRVLIQDPADAKAPSMPSHAIATGCADFVLPLNRLATAVLALTTAPGAADLLSVPLPPWASLVAQGPDGGAAALN